MTTPISHTREFLEERFGEAINAREQGVLPHLAECGGFGPPDLCWIRKAAVVGTGDDDADADPQGCYHFVLGLEVSSEACIAAYFANLVANVETPRSLIALVARIARGRGARRRIQGGIYCCYDAFSRSDVRCELTVPGGSQSYVINRDGQREDDVSQEVWRGAWVSAVIRALRADPTVLVDIYCLRRFDPLPTPAVEANFLAFARDLYLQGGVAMLTTKNTIMLDEDEGDAMGATIARYFILEQRNVVAVGFFSQLLTSVPFTVVNIATPLLVMGNASGAVGLLSAAFRSAKAGPQSASVLAAAVGAMLAVALAESGDLPASCGAAQEAAAAAGVDGDAPCASLAWMTLADVYSRNGSHALALATLNNMPLYFLETEQGQDGTFPISTHSFLLERTCSEPGGATVDPDTEAESRLREEANVSGHERLENLTASVMFPPKGRPWQATSIGERLRARTYETLVEIVDTLGWDVFLELRAEVFIMRAELDGDGGDVHGETEPDVHVQAECDARLTGIDTGTQTTHPETRVDSDDDDDSLAGSDEETGANRGGASAGIHSEPARTRHVDSEPKGASEDAHERRDAAAHVVHGELPANKQLCNVWLDEVIDALYEDLSEYMEWRLTDFEHHLHREQGGGRSEDGSDRDEDEDADGAGAARRGYDDDALARAPKMSQVDWLRRGQLCERLGRVEDAERAYRVCVHEDANYTAWTSLARIYVGFGWTEEALNSLHYAIEVLEAPRGKHGKVPRVVQHMLRAIVAKVGLQAVREVQLKDCRKDFHPAINTLLHDIVRWKVLGWDR